MPRRNIRAELSAQRMTAPVNPLLARALDRVGELGGDLCSLADQGCGKLRHLMTLRAPSRQLFLVDTSAQLDSPHRLGKVTRTVREYVNGLRRLRGERIQILNSEAFAKSRLQLGTVVSVATYDVVLRHVRRELAGAALRNLRRGGFYAIIVPRNHSTILPRCTEATRYQDGFAFPNHGAFTFFRNFPDSAGFLRQLGAGFELVDDLSIFRQLCVILRKV